MGYWSKGDLKRPNLPGWDTRAKGEGGSCRIRTQPGSVGAAKANAHEAVCQIHFVGMLYRADIEDKTNREQAAGSAGKLYSIVFPLLVDNYRCFSALRQNCYVSM
ncbi:hypothetical protein ABD76_26295 [Paenibacillus dendritiformis]|nr:hypothetical protein [Paenibacillus dendritiformis]